MTENKNFKPQSFSFKKENTSTKILGKVFLLFGFLSIIFAFALNSSILTFIGLGLTLWGALLQYLEKEKFIPKNIFDASMYSLINSINKLIQNMNYDGDPVYLPPSYVKNLQHSKVYISRRKLNILPTETQIQDQEDKMFLSDPDAMLINSPGESLLNFFEKKLGKEFTELDASFLVENFPSFLTEELEIADAVKLEIKKTSDKLGQNESYYNSIEITLQGAILNGQFFEENKPFLLSPLSSAFASAFAKVTGKPIKITKSIIQDDQLMLTFLLLEPILITPSRLETMIDVIKPPQFSIKNFLSLEYIFLIIGLVLIIFVSWISWSDFNLWQKNLFESLFETRTNELINLGLGLKLIHYLLIGIGFSVSGIFSIIKKNARYKLRNSP